MVGKDIFYAGVFLIFFIFSSCNNATNPIAQTGLCFTLRDPDTKTVAAGEVGKFRIEVKNYGPSSVNLVCVRTSNDLPDTSWSSSLCVGAKCLSSMVDSVNAELKAGCADTCAIDIQTGEAAGSACVAVKVYDKTDTTQVYEHKFTCAVSAAAK